LPRAAALLVLLVPALASAHDFWAEPAGGAFVFRRGHRGEVALPLDGSKVRSIRCAAGGGEVLDLRPRATAAEREVRLAARCDAVSASYDGGYFSLTPDGEVARPKDETPAAVRSWASRQHAKWIDPAAPAAARPLGDELELVPVTDLRRVRAGDKATFRVLRDGKPLPGAAGGGGPPTLGVT
jgi:nickel transport protein